jgi:FkbM family methyltransferase
VVNDINEFKRTAGNETIAPHQGANPLLLEAESIVIYGAGYNGVSALDFLRKADIKPDCFCDADSALWGRQILGIPIRNMDDLKTMNRNALVIISPQLASVQIEKQLRELGFSQFLFTEQNIGAHFALKGYGEGLDKRNETAEEARDKIDAVLSALQDEKSKDVFRACLDLWLSGNYLPIFNLREGHEYFPPDIIRLDTNEVFVDCGAYRGDTIEWFVNKTEGRYNHIFAFEPDPINYELAKASVKRNRAANVEIFPIAISDKKDTVMLNPSDLATIGSRITGKGGASIEVQTDSLDSLLPLRPTFIKMDIEGAELAALRGAGRIAQWNYPKLAVCVYHIFEHLWEIPYYIITRYPRYKVYLRQHGELHETVCYAVDVDQARS